MRPFEGIRVIDATHVLAGPFAAYQLGVLGADVIKIEDPNDPDQSRSSGTDKALNDAQMGTSFLTQASNKRSVALDLKQERDREILKELVKTADVFVENYRPGAFEALGLGYDALVGDQSAADLRLVLGVRPERPARQPDRLRPRHPGDLGHHGDDRHEGRASGQDRRAGGRLHDRHDRRVRAVVGALSARETGKGQRIDMAMLDVAMILMASHVTGYLRNGAHPKPHGNRHPHATNGAFATKDGTLVMLGASNIRQQKRLWKLLDRPDMAKKTNDERDADHAREIAVLEEIMLTRTADEWEAFLQARHVPAATRAHHGRGDRRPADREPRRHPSARQGQRHGGRIRRAARGLHVRPWRPAHRRPAADARPAQ